MLKDSDLEAFVELVRLAELETKPLSEPCPDTILRADARSGDLLHRNECARLCRSLRIACAAGDVSESSHRILDVIARSLKAEDHRYLPLTRAKEWLAAIRWAIPENWPLGSRLSTAGRRGPAISGGDGVPTSA